MRHLSHVRLFHTLLLIVWFALHTMCRCLWGWMVSWSPCSQSGSTHFCTALYPSATNERSCKELLGYCSLQKCILHISWQSSPAAARYSCVCVYCYNYCSALQEVQEIHHQPNMVYSVCSQKHKKMRVTEQFRFPNRAFTHSPLLLRLEYGCCCWLALHAWNKEFGN